MKCLKLSIFVFLACISACAAIPQESVTLSSELGNGIKKQHKAQVELLNTYFELKRKELDTALQRAISAYFRTIARSSSVTLTADEVEDVSKDMINLNNKNNAAKEALEKVRIELISRIEENYLSLNQANSAITGLLQSAVSVKESTSKASQLVSSATGGKIQFDKILSEIDAFVIKGGTDAGKAIELYDKAKRYIDN